MKNKMNLALLTCVLSAWAQPILANAEEFMPGREFHRHYSFYYNCIDDAWIRLDLSPTVELGTCEPGEALRLARTQMSYPKMKDNPYEVQYWKGSYTQKALEKTNYLHEVTNRCTGKTLVSEVKTVTHPNVLSFPVLNPNLKADVYASYQLLPMTEQEAKSALLEAKNWCEKYTYPVSSFTD